MARGEQHRKYVVALALVAAALLDQLVDHRVGLLPQAHEPGPRPTPAELLLQERQQRDRSAAHLEDPRQAVPQPVEARAGVEPEYGPKDHLEGQSLHPRMQGHRLVARPPLRLALGDLPHQAGECRDDLHALARAELTGQPDLAARVLPAATRAAAL